MRYLVAFALLVLLVLSVYVSIPAMEREVAEMTPADGLYPRPTGEQLIAEGAEVESEAATSLSPAAGGARITCSESEEVLERVRLRVRNGERELELPFTSSDQSFMANNLTGGAWTVSVAGGSFELVEPVAFDVVPGAWAEVSVRLRRR